MAFRRLFQRRALLCRGFVQLGAERLCLFVCQPLCLAQLFLRAGGYGQQTRRAVFFRLRCCNRAQWEIRDAACAALAALRKTSPLLFSLYGPTCFVSGKCPEGKMTCGQQAEIRKKFSK